MERRPKGGKGPSAASSRAGSAPASRAPSAPTSPVGGASTAWGAGASTFVPDAGHAKAAPAAKPAAAAGTAKPLVPGGPPPAALAAPVVAPGAPGVPGAPKSDKLITPGADAFIYEEYGFPSAAEPVPSANPLLILSVMVAYLLLVAAGFLIIKYAYHGYDIDAPDAHTVTNTNQHDPLPIDETVLKGGSRRHREERRFTGRPGRGAAGRGGHRRAAHGVSRRRPTTPPTLAEEEAVTQWAPAVEYMAEVLDNHELGAGTRTGSSDSTEAVEGSGGDSEASPPVTPARRWSARPKNLNKTG